MGLARVGCYLSQASNRGLVLHNLGLGYDWTRVAEIQQLVAAEELAVLGMRLARYDSCLAGVKIAWPGYGAVALGTVSCVLGEDWLAFVMAVHELGLVDHIC